MPANVRLVLIGMDDGRHATIVKVVVLSVESWEYYYLLLSHATGEELHR